MRIIYEDSELIVCIKPVGILSQKGSNGTSSMEELLCEHRKENGERPEIFPVHRLDQGVGGIMVYAKNKNSAARLTQMVSERILKKEYYAVVQGVPEEEKATLKDLLFKDSKKNKSYVVKRMRKGVKEASLEYEKKGEAGYKDGRISLVHIKLHTGRTHQIRVQFSSRKMPLLGDGKYGSRDSNMDIALWSYALHFPHPKTKEEMNFEAPFPEKNPWSLFGDMA